MPCFGEPAWPSNSKSVGHMKHKDRNCPEHKHSRALDTEHAYGILTGVERHLPEFSTWCGAEIGCLCAALFKATRSQAPHHDSHATLFGLGLHT